MRSLAIDVQELKPIQAPYARAARRMAADPRVRRAIDQCRGHSARTVRDQVALASINAPSYHEGPRAQAYRDLFCRAGMPASIDRFGNVVCRIRGTGADGTRPVVAVAGHLDSVFAPGTDTTVTHQGAVYKAPGIGDDARGLAVVLEAARILRECGLETVGDIVFAGTVCEEATGNFEGVKGLVTAPHDLDAFIAVDGHGLGVLVHGSISGRFLKFSFMGPGGHAWGNAGRPSAANALARFVEAASRIALPADPRTTLNVGVMSAGRSVSAICEQAFCQIDTRSLEWGVLLELEQTLRACARSACEEENRLRPPADLLGGVSCECTVTASRHGGLLAEDCPALQAARAGMEVVGVPLAQYRIGGSDLTLTSGIGLPSACLPAGGVGAGVHSLEESWEDDGEAHRAVSELLVTLLILAGLSGVTEPTLPRIPDAERPCWRGDI